MDIKEARERYDRYLRLDSLITEKGRQLALQQDKLNALYRQLEKENKDVEALEKTSFSTLFIKMTGQMQERKEKEVQEARIVELRFKDAKRIEEELIKELQDLKTEQNELNSAKEDYKEALALKRDSLSIEDQDGMYQLQEELEQHQSMIKEIEEALEAGEEVKEMTNRVLKSLSSAQNWGVVDMIGALDFIADLAKHQKINEAKQMMNNLESAIRRFKTELVDIHFDSSLQVNISSMDTMLDFVFDNMFMDMMIQSKINQAKSEMQRLQQQVNSVVSQLNQQLDKTESNIILIKEKIRRFIEES